MKKIGNYIVDSPQQPEGLQESSRWSESAETTGSGEINFVAPRRGARSFAVKIFYVDLTSGTPSGCGHN